MQTAIVSVTNSGDEISKKIGLKIESHIYTRKMVVKQGINNVSKKLMRDFNNIIFISSTGIAVRAIAPYIKSKDVDPAVIVIDSSGKFVISLLSGHLGGANELAVKVASIIGAQPIITTATDNLGIVAPDTIAKEHSLVIDDLKKAKEVSAKLVHGENIIFVDEDGSIKTPKGYFIPNIDNLKLSRKMDFADINKYIMELNEKELYEFFKDNNISGMVLVTNKRGYSNIEEIPVLRLIRKNIIVGIGCRKNFDKNKMLETVLYELENLNIDYRALCTVATVEIKKHEEAIISLAKTLDAQLNIFSIEDIKKIQHKYQGSSFVEKTIGVKCVCDPCVELAGGKIFLKNKLKREGMTCAIGKRF